MTNKLHIVISFFVVTSLFLTFVVHESQRWDHEAAVEKKLKILETQMFGGPTLRWKTNIETRMKNLLNQVESNSRIEASYLAKVEERIKNLNANSAKVEANPKVEINTKFEANHVAEMEMVKGVPIYWGLNGLEENDPYLIESIKNSVLWPPSSPNKKLNLRGDDIKGQYGQPDHVEKILKENNLWNKNGRQGFFIEAGAAGGEMFSNSLYFEKDHNWTGLLVEPNPDWWKELKGKNRKAWILPHCISLSNKVELVDFDVSAFIGGVMNPDEKSKKPSDISREGKKQDYERTLKTQCFPLQAVLSALENPTIDYFSLDIEGAEYAVLKTLDFKNKVDITVLGIEVNHAGEIFAGSRDDIGQLLKDNGYSFSGTVKIDDFYIKNTKS